AHFVTEGYQVALAGSGQVARAMLADHIPDLILMDLLLPDGNGLQLCHEIKARYAIPIIIITVVSEYETQIEALRDVAEYFFIKPFDEGKLGVLSASMARALKHYGGGPAEEYAIQHLAPTIQVNLH